MPRRNYKGQRRAQLSKRARLHRKQAIFAKLPRFTAHPSHIAWRKNRNANRRYKWNRFRNKGKDY